MSGAASTDRDLVLTIMHGGDFNYFASFALSLKKTGFRGSTVLFASAVDAEFVEKARACGVLVVPFNFPDRTDCQRLARAWTIWRLLFSAPLPIRTKRRLAHRVFHLRYRRYLFYSEFLETRVTEFDRVLLADSRDVFFQSDPFAWDWSPGVHFVLEEPIQGIGVCAFHRNWMHHQFGKSYVDQHAQKIPACAGTTYGDISGMRQYLNAMVDSTMKARDLSKFSNGDNGIHNYVLVENLVDQVIVHKNRHGPVLSMAHMMDSGWQTGADGTVLNDNGELVPVLHQYDRFPALKARLLNSL